jgi:hypothetical protein
MVKFLTMRIEKIALVICLAIFTVGGVWTIAGRLTYSNQNHALRIFQQSCVGNRSGDKWKMKQATVLYSCDGMDNTADAFYIPLPGKSVRTILSDLEGPRSGFSCFVVGANWVISLIALDYIVMNNWSDSAVAAENYASLTGGKVVSFAANGGCSVGHRY